MENSVGRNESRSMGIKRLHDEKSKISSADRSRIGAGGPLKRTQQRNEGDWVATRNSNAISENQNDQSLSVLHSAEKKHENESRFSDLKLNGALTAEEPGVPYVSKHEVDGLLTEENGTLHVSESSGDFKSSFPGKSNESNPIGHLSACLEGSIVFPKRPRGASRKKKSSKSLIPSTELTGASKNSPNANARPIVSELANGSDALISPTVGKKTQVSDESKDDSKGNRKRGVLEVPLLSKDGKLGKNNTAKERMQKKRRKNKDFSSGRETLLENGGHLLEDDNRSSQDNLENEEANLEQNAAHMLSSRFNTGCTRSSDAGPSVVSRAIGSESLTILDDDLSGSSSSLLDASGRLLRHKKQNFKEIIRRRRRFYEVHASDTDPYWVLKQRIKIFHRLEQNWRFGLVKDYNPDTGTHSVKFDDSNEEWIDLQKERIKLLLFSSEISRKFASQHGKETKQKNKQKPQANKDDNAIGNLKDTEPIISWLTRLNQRVRKFSLNKVKKKGSFSDKRSVSPLLLGHEVNCGGLSEKSDEIFNNNGPEAVGDELPISRAKREDRRFSVIYSRRRYCKHMESSPYTNSHAGLAETERSLEFNIPFGILKISQEAMKSRLPPCAEYCWLYNSFWMFQYGVLVPLWPLAHLEFLIVDKCMGLKSISLEGCLQQLVTLLCSFVCTSHWSFTCMDHAKLCLPFCLVTFKLLGKGNRGRCFVFMAQCLEVENSKWTHLDCNLKRHALNRQITFSECSSDIDMMPHLSKMPSLEALRRGSSLDSWLQSASQDSNSSILTDANVKQEYLPCSSSVSHSSPVLAEPLVPVEENGITDNCQHCNTDSAQDCQENHEKMTDDSCSPPDDSSERISEIRVENRGSSMVQAAEGLSCSHSKAEIDDPSVSSDGDWRRSSHNSLISDLNMYGTISSCTDLTKNRNSKKFLRSQRLPRRIGSWRVAWKPHASPLEDVSSPDKSDDGTQNYLNSTFTQKNLQGRVEAQQADQLESDLTLKPLQVDLASLASNVHGITQNTGSPSNHYSPQYGTGDFLQDGFSSSYRKPRTQVSYSLPLRGYELSSNSRVQQRKVQPCKKIKTDNAKKAFSRDNPASITCEANVLVSEADRGWREEGALVVLGTEDQDWKILVKLSGETKYTHKADQFLQPGITNRYTHAMMWKGGNSWMLEFTDRGQWAIFKEMHEECYNWNIRAASVKNIPIPGVRLIDENEDNTAEVPFIRPPKYFRQVGTEVDVALNTYNVLYDMDSDDEVFVSVLEKKFNDDANELPQITEETFEKAIDMLEKLAYTQQHDELPDDDVENLLSEIGIETVEIIRSIYDHWKIKRTKKGVPLIRQFQPALWEQYQKQIKEWESAMNKRACSSQGTQEKRPVEKPPMFAFCLRPRGLELLNKGSFQRPHRKLAVAVQQNAFTRERNSIHTYGKKLNKQSFGDEAFLSYDVPSEVSPWFSSPRAWNSPRESANSVIAAKTARRVDKIEQHLKLQRKNSKRFEMLQYHGDAQMTGKTYRQRPEENSSDWYNSRYPPSSRGAHYDDYEEDHDDLEEFRLRDAASAAQHAVNMAKLKREKAQWLLHKADLAAHRAAVALITAEAVKASEKDMTCDLQYR